MRREFQFVEGTSSKFWAITLEGKRHTVEFGKIGTKGQTKTKEFASPAAAKTDADKLVVEKTKKGYVAVNGGAPAPADDDEAGGDEAGDDEPPAKPVKGKGKAAPAKAAPPPALSPDRVKSLAAAFGAPASAPPPAPATAPAAPAARGIAGRRAFQCTEGGSAKSWMITVLGAMHMVEFGKLGKGGQVKSKKFASEAEAQADAAKLIAEKLKKGYVEVGGGAQAGAKDAGPTPSTPARAAKPGKATKGAAPAEADGDDDAAEAPAVDEATGADEPPVADAPGGAEASGSGDVAPLVVERELKLTPADLLFATWRPRPPAGPAPKVPPFDGAATLEALKRVKSLGWKGHDWGRAKIPVVMSAEEARCWLLAMCTSHGSPLQQTADGIVAAAASAPADPVEWVFEVLGKARGLDTPLLVRVLMHVVPADRVLDVLLDDRLGQLNSRAPATVADGVRLHLLLRLDDAAFARAAERVRERFDPAGWPPAGGYVSPPILFSVAPLFGLHAELLALVEGWADDAFSAAGTYSAPDAAQRVVLGLGSASLVEQHMRRLKLHPRSSALVRGWLATTGHDALDWAQAAVERAGNKEEAAELAEALAVAVSVENAPVMLALRSSKAAAVAGAWLDAHPGTAACGLVEQAAGRGAPAEAALAHLRTLQRAGHDLRPLVELAPADAAAKVRAALFEQAPAAPPLQGTPAWLAAAGLKPATLPSLAQPAALPPLVTEGKALTPEHLGVVLAALRETAKTGALHPVVAAVRERCTPGSRDAFGWALFERWLAEGAPPKEKWAFQALGHLGSDASALRLAPLVREWPGESQHQRAVTGLEVLRAIGTDTALMQLSGISQKVKFKALKQRAQDLMEEIARGRGLSRAELEDRIVPTCDLDERGTRVFDFGPRRFHFTLGPDLKPMVKDADGELVGDLPKPGKKDDPAKAEEAVAAWKLLKKQVKEVATIQAGRLEQAMVTGRRWRRADFEALLVRHPLLTHLVRLLVWGAHDAKGERTSTFRVAEDGTFADAQDEPLTLEGASEVSLVHPLHLTPAERAAWGQLLADYQLIPPFEQLGRPIHEATAEEKKRTDLDRLAGKKVPPTTLVGILDRTGWTRGVPQDGGVYFEHTKHFPGADATAVLQYDGIPIGGMMDWQDVAVERLFFVPGQYQVVSYPDHEERKKLGDVDPVAVSEVLRLLEVLREKAR